MNHDPTWMARALEGDLDPAEHAEFIRALEQDPALLETWARHAELHGLLGPALEAADAREQRAAACVDAATRQDQDTFAREVERKILRVQFRRRMLWAAAAVFVIGMVAFWNKPNRSPVATVIGSSGVHDKEAPSAGAQFAKGERLRISSGLMELDLAGNGRMVVEGPAEIAWSAPLASRLESGRAFLNINQRGHGYRVDTPQGSITDLGTEFGVAIDPLTGKVETHVITGSVEALPGGGTQPVLLRKNEALRFSSNETEKITANPGAFYRIVTPPRTRQPGMLHWSMDDTKSNNLPARTAHLTRTDDSGNLEHSAGRVPGPFGSALQFNGLNMIGFCKDIGIPSTPPLTVAFWVKLPNDLKSREHNSMITWGDFSTPETFWQISLNLDAKLGPVSFLRVQTHDEQTTATTNLRDDRWHHVAVVLPPPAGPDSGQQVMVFIDGEMQALTNRTLRTPRIPDDKARISMELGRNPRNDTKRWRHFRGSLDELYFFNNTLTQAEIRALMERNEAPADAGR